MKKILCALLASLMLISSVLAGALTVSAAEIPAAENTSEQPEITPESNPVLPESSTEAEPASEPALPENAVEEVIAPSETGSDPAAEPESTPEEAGPAATKNAGPAETDEPAAEPGSTEKPAEPAANPESAQEAAEPVPAEMEDPAMNPESTVEPAATEEPAPDPEYLPAEGPEDIWEAIFALEKERAVYTPEEHEALFPEIESIIFSSPSYQEGTMEYRGGILFWRDDDCLNGYDPKGRARENGYVDSSEISSQTEALLSALEAQVEAEIAAKEAEAEDAGLLSEMTASEYDVGVFLPYDGYEGGGNFDAWENFGNTAAFFTGGSVTSWKGANATVDRLAALVRDCEVVLIGTHGSGSGQIAIHSSAGITTADKSGNHAWNGGSFWSIDGTVIANHMTKNAGECIVISGSCEGMKSDALCTPLRNKGVDVVFGFSESVSCGGADLFSLSFIRNLGLGKTVAEAFRNIKAAAGCDWDPIYYNLTLAQAQEAEVAFPIVVSAQDSYPGVGQVNIVQNVKSTWMLPKKPSQSSSSDWFWTTKIITKGSSITISARVDTTEKYTKVSRDDANLPPGMYQTWSQEEGIKIYGTPTKKGLYQTQHKITTESGKVITHNFRIMVRDTAVTTRSKQTITFNAKDVAKWGDSKYLNSSESWYASLNFNSDDSTYDMELISGYIPYTLYYGFSDGSTGYIRSESSEKNPGYYEPTVPGTYTGTFEIVTYSGSVYRLPVEIVVKPAHTYSIDTYYFECKAFQPFNYNLPRDSNHKELTDDSRWDGRNCRDIRLHSGSLPPGLYFLNSYNKPCGFYGIPTKPGSYTAVVDVYTYEDRYRYTLRFTITAVQCGNNAYCEFSDDGTLTITGSGSMWNFASREKQPWYAVADRIKKVVIENGITSVGGNAFSYCENLTSVSLPASVKTIGLSSFRDCYALWSIALPADLTSIGGAAFSNCTNLAFVTIPDKVTDIGISAFAGCQNLTMATIGSSVKTIGGTAFGNCKKLGYITFKGNAPSIASDSFYNVTANVSYPKGNSTYTSAVKVNYGGKLTWDRSVTGISLSPASIEIAAGSSYLLSAAVKPTDADNHNVTWTSSNPKIATVNANGYVTGVSMGKATITAKTEDGGYTAKCNVRVLFSDVTNKNLAAYDAIYWGTDNNVVAGYGSYFDIDAPCTRAQFVLFLWRAAGRPNPKSTNLKFKDAAAIKALAPDYTKAIAWGSEKGIVAGFTSGANAGKFCPNDPCTRAQVVMFLWRYKGKPSASAALTFKDTAEIKKMAPDYTKAISWAVSKKITTGFSDNTFRPNADCTRGQCVTFIYRVFK